MSVGLVGSRRWWPHTWNAGLWASSRRGADPRDIFEVWGTREVSVPPSMDVFRSKPKTAQSSLV